MTSPLSAAVAPLRRAVPALAFDARTVFIVVSGYAPVAAVAFYTNSHRVAAGVGLTVPVTDPTIPTRARCHGCWSWRPGDDMQDERLGWRWWCSSCVASGIARCEAQHGRLPAHHEFWCWSCGEIRQQASDAQGMNAAGRRRYVCLHCRRAQYRRRQPCAGGCGLRRVRHTRRRVPWWCEPCAAVAQRRKV